MGSGKVDSGVDTGISEKSITVLKTSSSENSESSTSHSEEPDGQMARNQKTVGVFSSQSDSDAEQSDVEVSTSEESTTASGSETSYSGHSGSTSNNSEEQEEHSSSKVPRLNL